MPSPGRRASASHPYRSPGKKSWKASTAAGSQGRSRMKSFEHVHAASMASAVTLMGTDGRSRPVAGGTDLLPLLKLKKGCPGIKVTVANVFPSIPVPLVGARLGHDVNRRYGGTTVSRRAHAGVDFHLLDRLRWRMRATPRRLGSRLFYTSRSGSCCPFAVGQTLDGMMDWLTGLQFIVRTRQGPAESRPARR